MHPQGLHAGPMMTTTTTSIAPDSLVDLRLHVLLPYSVARAQSRLARLRQLFLCDPATRQRSHDDTLSQVLCPMRLTKSVRGVASVKDDEERTRMTHRASGELHVPVTGGVDSSNKMCVPFTTCTTLFAGLSGQVMTGSVDGMLTLWDVARCVPQCSQWVTASAATAPSRAGQSVSRIRAISAHPHSPLVFVSSMFDPHVVSLWRVCGTDEDAAEDTNSGRSAANLIGGDCGRRIHGTMSRHNDSTRVGHAGAGRRITGIHRVAVQDSTGDEQTRAHSTHAHICRCVGEVVYGLDVDPSGSLLATAHGRLAHADECSSSGAEVRLWDIRGARAVGSVAAPMLYTHRGYDAFDHTVGNGHTHASTSKNNPTSCSRRAAECSDRGAAAVRAVRFHPDASLLASVDAGGAVVCWDVRCGTLAWTTARCVGGGHVGRGRCLAWSPCGVQFASGGEDGVVHLCDARMLHRSQHALPSSSTYTRPATAATTAWASGRSCVGPFRMLGHTDAVTSVSFYTNPRACADVGRTLPVGLVTTSLDGTVRLWDGQTGRCVRTMAAGAPVYDHCRPGECAEVDAPVELGTHACAGRAPNRRKDYAHGTIHGNACRRDDGAATDDDGEYRERRSVSASSILTVGRSKYWSLWDCVSGVGEEAEWQNGTRADSAAVVCETNIVLTASMASSAATGAVTVAADWTTPHDDDDADDDDAGESESEDEMTALRRVPVRCGGADEEEEVGTIGGRTGQGASSQSHPRGAVTRAMSDGDSSEEDEMSRLLRRPGKQTRTE